MHQEKVLKCRAKNIALKISR